MKNVITYEFNEKEFAQYSETVVAMLEEVLVEENGLDVIVSSFSYNEILSINIDCISLKDKNIEEVKMLSDKVIKGLKYKPINI